MHTCELPNGDQIKHRKVYFYSIIGDISKVILWHSNANNGPPFSDKSWYVPKDWLKFNQELGYAVEGCKESQVFGKWIFISNNAWYVKKGDKLISSKSPSSNNIFPELNKISGSNFTPEEERELHESWSRDEAINNERIQCESEHIANITLYCKAYDVPRFGQWSVTRDRIEARKLKLYGFDEGLRLTESYFFGEYNNVLWSEVGLKKLSDSCTSEQADCPIAIVWQSHSTDNGKTWNKPIITKDAKLFVIGKSIKEQPGVAKDKGTVKYIGWF